MDIPENFKPLFRTSPVLELIGSLYCKGEGADLVLGLRAEAKHCNARGAVHRGMLDDVCRCGARLYGGVFIYAAGRIGDGESQPRFCGQRKGRRLARVLCRYPEAGQSFIICQLLHYRPDQCCLSGGRPLDSSRSSTQCTYHRISKRRGPKFCTN
jgi:hypothetical protein